VYIGVIYSPYTLDGPVGTRGLLCARSDVMLCARYDVMISYTSALLRVLRDVNAEMSYCSLRCVTAYFTLSIMQCMSSEDCHYASNLSYCTHCCDDAQILSKLRLTETAEEQRGQPQHIGQGLHQVSDICNIMFTSYRDCHKP
jgi:hypothetical protein